MSYQLICEETLYQPAEYSWKCDGCGVDLYYEKSVQINDEDLCLSCLQEFYPDRWTEENEKQLKGEK